MTLRITGGSYKGKRLAVPANPDLRPTPEKVREAFFNLIGADIRDSRFLDAFAGTGAMGLEALSRGASFAVFIEQDPATAASIRENIQKIGAFTRSLVIEKNFFSASMTIKGTCDILFFDPPYHQSLYLDILDHLNEGLEIRDTCSIALEHFKKSQLPDRVGHLVKSRCRAYGDTVLSFYKRRARKKVLFICTGNAARSQMAEGLMRTLFGKRFEAFSAGTQPGKVHPLAIQAMDEMGIDISGHRSKGVDTFHDVIMDYVITVCDNARETCPYFPARMKNFHRPFTDPAAAEGTEENKLAVFREVRDEIKSWMEITFGSF